MWSRIEESLHVLQSYSRHLEVTAGCLYCAYSACTSMVVFTLCRSIMGEENHSK